MPTRRSISRRHHAGNATQDRRWPPRRRRRERMHRSIPSPTVPPFRLDDGGASHPRTDEAARQHGMPALAGEPATEIFRPECRRRGAAVMIRAGGSPDAARRDGPVSSAAPRTIDHVAPATSGTDARKRRPCATTIIRHPRTGSLMTKFRRNGVRRGFATGLGKSYSRCVHSILRRICRRRSRLPCQTRWSRALMGEGYRALPLKGP